MGLNIHSNVRCMIFRNLTYFDALLGFVWGQARYGSWQAIDNYFLPVFTANFWESMSLTSLLASSVLPHFIFAHKIFKIHLLNQMNYWTISLILIPYARSPKPRKEASWCLTLMHHSLNAIFSLNFFSDQPVRIVKSLARYIGTGGALNLCSPQGYATS